MINLTELKKQARELLQGYNENSFKVETLTIDNEAVECLTWETIEGESRFIAVQNLHYLGFE